MKRSLFYGLIITLLAAPALAGQGERTPDFDRLADRLGLDDSQTAQFTAAMQAQHERNQARIAPLRAQMKQAKSEIQQETLATASGILTAEQMEKFEQMQERRAERRGKRKTRHSDRERGGDEQL